MYREYYRRLSLDEGPAWLGQMTPYGGSTSLENEYPWGPTQIGEEEANKGHKQGWDGQWEPSDLTQKQTRSAGLYWIRKPRTRG